MGGEHRGVVHAHVQQPLPLTPRCCLAVQVHGALYTPTNPTPPSGEPRLVTYSAEVGNGLGAGACAA